MLMVGAYNKNVVDSVKGMDKVHIYNLCSYIEGFDKLPSLLPMNRISYDDEKDFDEKYFDYIINNADIMVFAQFFNLVQQLHNNTHIFLLITKEPAFELVYESLLKLIQQRYGYISNHINDLDDLYDLEDKADFSLNGLYNYDNDKKRFDDIMIELNVYDKVEG